MVRPARFERATFTGSHFQRLQIFEEICTAGAPDSQSAGIFSNRNAVTTSDTLTAAGPGGLILPALPAEVEAAALADLGAAVAAASSR